MAELPPLPPGFTLDSQQAGPIMGPPPKPEKPAGPPSGYRQVGEGLEFIPGGPADPSRDKPNLPSGYRMGPNGVAERIPGIPEGAGADPKLTESERNAAFLATRVAGGIQDLNAAVSQDPDANQPSILGTVAGVFGEGARNLANTPERRQVEAAQMDILDAALTLGTGAAYTKEQIDAYRTSYFPGLTDDPETVAAKRQRLVRLLEAAKLKAGTSAPMIDQALAAVGGQQPIGQQEAAGAPPPPVPGTEEQYVGQSRNLAEIEAPSGDQMVRSQGTQTVTNPELAGVRGEYLRRLEANQSPGEIVRFLRSAGIADPKILQSAVQQAQYRKQYPSVPIANYNTSALDQMDVPLSATESMLNSAAQSGPGAYAMNAGQAASFNTLDEVAGMTGGNAERVNLALEDSRRTSPVASTLGTVSGSVMGALGTEAGLARAGMSAGVPRALLADVAYGAGSGAGGAEEGQRLSGAATGATMAGAGSLGGQLVAKGVGSAISPTGGRLSELYEQGVRPTPGQRMMAAGDGRGLSGLVGRVVGTTEEAIGSIPIVGAGIRGARQEARDQFQIGAYNQALKEIGTELPKGTKPGTAPYAFTKKAIGDVYDKARSGMRVAPDQELATDVATIRSRVDDLEEASQKRFESIVENKLMRRTGQTIEGADFKTIQSELGKIIAGIRKSQRGDGELADALGDLQGALDRAARRHSDPEAVALLDKADAGWAKFVRIRDAAKSRGGGAAEFSPTQLDRSVQRMSPGQHSDAYLRGDALMQDYAQQGMALTDRLPNSGTADRLMTGAAAGGAVGAGIVEPSSLGVLGILGSLYAPGVRKLTTGVMAPRGPKAKAIGEAVKKRARIAGAAGSGVALSAQKDDDR